ncbi:predicted protein [Naegleria gruberi]|uniref:Predicted protein n=1 Tax=Naegleria gruberi TaxID=5762 RepID=D2VL51_NAEGR|nr:uncharacterized protein NAEGRDRAFT_69663 [Naegleria gruberi]EFC42480.1 predicted protein [Naegleria gruberi]|eukprot:XP_002675224.1 predicted protein [Naegleria gruberi strain NEG-M]
MFIVSYLNYFRRSLFQIKERREAENFFHSIHACDLEKILAFAYDIQKTQYESSVQKLIAKSYGSFSFLPKGHYNISIRFPEYSVDYQLKQRERIVKSEEDFDRARNNYIQLKKHNEEFEIEHRNWLIRQKALIEVSKTQEEASKKMEREILEEKERVRQMELEERLKNVEYLQERRKMLANLHEAELNAKTLNQQRYMENLTIDTHNEIKHKMTEMQLGEIEKMEQAKLQDIECFVNPPSNYYFTKNPSATSPRKPETVNIKPLAKEVIIPVFIPPEQAKQPVSEAITKDTTEINSPEMSEPNSKESSFADCLQVHLLGNEINSLEKEIESTGKNLTPKDIKLQAIIQPEIPQKKKVKKKKKLVEKSNEQTLKQKKKEASPKKAVTLPSLKQMNSRMRKQNKKYYQKSKGKQNLQKERAQRRRKSKKAILRRNHKKWSPR